MVPFEEVVQYISGYDPDFAGSILPASAAEVAELEKLIRGPLPEVYLDYLSVMGKSTGWVQIDDIDFSVDTALVYYRRENWLPASRFLRIGTDSKDPSYHPYLRMHPAIENLEVFGLPGCTKETFRDTMLRHVRPIAGSLQEMFCRPVFRIFEVFGPARNPVYLQARSWRYGQIGEAQTLLMDRFGFEPVRWSSSSGRGYLTQGAAAELCQRPGRPLSLLIRYDDPVEQAKTAAVLAEVLDAGISTPAAP